MREHVANATPQHSISSVVCLLAVIPVAVGHHHTHHHQRHDPSSRPSSLPVIVTDHVSILHFGRKPSPLTMKPAHPLCLSPPLFTAPTNTHNDYSTTSTINLNALNRVPGTSTTTDPITTNSIDNPSTKRTVLRTGALPQLTIRNPHPPVEDFLRG